MRQLRAPELDETILPGRDQSPRGVVNGVDTPLVSTQSLLEPPVHPERTEMEPACKLIGKLRL